MTKNSNSNSNSGGSSSSQPQQIQYCDTWKSWIGSATTSACINRTPTPTPAQVCETWSHNLDLKLAAQNATSQLIDRMHRTQK